MTGALGLAVLLLVALIVVGVIGPVVLAAARPHLAGHPRAAIALLGGLGSAWIIGLAAAGPAIAWAVSGPALLPGAAGAVCQQCLVAANPFSSQPLHAGVPSAVLLGASALVLATIAVSVLRELLVRSPRVCRASGSAADAGTPVTIAGVRVRIVDSPAAFVIALPARCGGITLSRGALALLDEDELRAVVAHETVHLAHRHHLIAAVATGVTAPLRWVPFLAACTRMILELLEIDADAGALREAGATALVSALVKLQDDTVRAGHSRRETGAPSDSGGESAFHSGSIASSRTGTEAPSAGVLFALGSGPWHSSDATGPSARVRSLLGTGVRPRRWPTAGLAVFAAPMTVVGAGVHVAGAAALLSGCALV